MPSPRSQPAPVAWAAGATTVSDAAVAAAAASPMLRWRIRPVISRLPSSTAVRRHPSSVLGAVVDEVVHQWGQAPRDPGPFVVEGVDMRSLPCALARTFALSLLPWAGFMVVLLIDEWSNEVSPGPGAERRRRGGG